MQTVSLFLSSATATDYEQSVGTFRVNFDNPIQIPRDAKTCQLRVIQADIWNLVSNVSPSVGDKISIQIGGVGTVYVLTVPEGQYSVEALNAAIQNELIINGLVATNLVISADAATQKVLFSTDTAGTIVSFPTADSMYNILGFPLGGSLTLTTALATFTAPNIAAFNNVNTFLVHSDIVDGGIPVNGKNLGVIAKVPITVRSGSLIPFAPGYPIAVSCNNIIGSSIQSIQVWLTSEDGFTRVNTREDFGVLIELSYV
jgi:hypothetical protein